MDVLDRYLESIADIPILDRNEQIEIGREIAKARRRFFLAVALMPWAGPQLVRRWRALVDAGRSVEPLVESFRGPGGSRRGHAFATRMDRLTKRLRDGAPMRSVAREFLAAGVALGVVEEIWREPASDALRAPDLQRLQRHARRAHTRYEELRAHLTLHNLRLVIPFAKRFRHRGVDFLDLIQEGNKALMRAVEKFDPERGHGFVSYATWWIEQAMVRAIQTQGRTVRLPTHAHQLRREFLDRERTMLANAPDEPTRADVAQTLDVRGDRIRKLDATLARIVSADQPLRRNEDAVTLGESLVDTKQPEPSEIARQRELSEALSNQITALSARERRILELRFGFLDDDEHTLEAIGKQLGITRERVRQIERRALSRLREREGVRTLARELGIGLNEGDGGEDRNAR